MRSKIIMATFLSFCLSSNAMHGAPQTTALEYANRISYTIRVAYDLFENDITFPVASNWAMTIEILEKLHSSMTQLDFEPKNQAQRQMYTMGSEFMSLLADHIKFLRDIQNEEATPDLVRRRGKATNKMDAITLKLGKFIQDNKKHFNS